ncbi:L-arabinose ABC transporter ATP-binding protein AraG [Sphingomonas baiyangensis]|uniref:L-arabinose ABC transporter ATP-binding protein AraG n=1 Tax=Sphingomonas baiyangensis TaxID=2572576 RepID=A0A4U1L5J3_9SPHN|nr:L-arabinose ABC transporter ATP-binding protein AraG [Sphingomonas baiyangensis]TKD51834.1 L-arabinose ABC transporter ATP-binding protein AraG [Sphingomonas baiyangensis]
MTALLEYRGVGKRFPGVVALDDVCFAVRGGEVRALIGENGAGKSTLLKILGGQYRPDSGTLAVAGEARSFASPRESQDAGIAIIHQELQLAPELSVAENLLLGALPRRHGLLDRIAMRERARAVLARLGEPIDPDTRLGDLSIGRRQMVEIGRALLRDARIIAFDEPTSSLSTRETERLMAIIGDLRAEGRAIIYVSHRMEEVFALADSATVLRDGRHVLDAEHVSADDEPRLLAAMAGREIADIYAYRPRTHGDVAMRVAGLAGPGVRAPVDLAVARGEVLGLFGLVGAGRSELFRLIFGAVRPHAGHVEVEGRALPPGEPRAAIAAGLALAPEDRKDQGIVPVASVRENVALAWRNLARATPLLRRATEAAEAARQIGTMRVKAASPDVAIATLSGGNQQKAIIARWLMAGARILLLDEPTRGIDVGARSEIYGHIYGFAEDGGSVLFASSDMAEVLGVADRIVVMCEGRIAGIVDRADATADRLLRLALPERGTRNPFLDDEAA